MTGHHCILGLYVNRNRYRDNMDIGNRVCDGVLLPAFHNMYIGTIRCSWRQKMTREHTICLQCPVKFPAFSTIPIYLSLIQRMFHSLAKCNIYNLYRQRQILYIPSLENWDRSLVVYCHHPCRASTNKVWRYKEPTIQSHRTPHQMHMHHQFITISYKSM